MSGFEPVAATRSSVMTTSTDGGEMNSSDWSASAFFARPLRPDTSYVMRVPRAIGRKSFGRSACGLRLACEVYIPCPEERSVPVDPERLRQWAVDAETLARLIAAVTELSRPVEEQARGFWSLGRRRVAGRFREFCLAVRPSADALNSARSYFAPVVLAVDGIGAWKESGIATFFLPDVASLAGDRLVVDLDYHRGCLASGSCD